MGEKSLPTGDSNFENFCNILTGLMGVSLLFEFGEILAFILFHFESDLLGETFLPNGLKTIS